MVRIRRHSDLKPGRYLKGKTDTGESIFRTLTVDDIRRHVEGTNRLIAKGYEPPLLLEHAPLNSPDGSPVNKNKWDEKASKVRNGSGWLKAAFVGTDGSMGYDIDVTDADVARKLEDGSIKFTSPELRPAFTTGDGETIEAVIAHAALTHQPRNPIQSASEAIAMSMQFSLDNLEDEDEKEKKEGDEEVAVKAEDKDGDGEIEGDEIKVDGEEVPAEEAVSETVDMKIHKSIYDTFVGMIRGKGVGLPDDVTPETLIPALIASMSGVSIEESDKSKVEEESAPVQYSLDDLDKPELSKLLVKAIRSESDRTKNQIKSVKIPALQKRLEDLAGVMQFSADADELPSLKVSEVVSLIADTIPDAIGRLFVDSEQFSVVEHHDSQFLGGEVRTAEDAKRFVDKQAESVPLLRK